MRPLRGEGTGGSSGLNGSSGFDLPLLARGWIDAAAVCQSSPPVIAIERTAISLAPISFNSPPTAEREYQSLNAASQERTEGNPEPAGGGSSSSGGGGGGIDYMIMTLTGKVSAASEKLALAMRTGIGIPAAQAEVAAAKANLASYKGKKKSKAQEGRVRPKPKRKPTGHHPRRH